MHSASRVLRFQQVSVGSGWGIARIFLLNEICARISLQGSGWGFDRIFLLNEICARISLQGSGCKNFPAACNLWPPGLACMSAGKFACDVTPGKIMVLGQGKAFAKFVQASNVRLCGGISLQGLDPFAHALDLRQV